MMNKKKTLIETLHGSFMFIDNLPDLINKEDIYDNTGHVDTEFLMAILQWMRRMADIQLKIQKSLNKLLGVDDLPEKNGKQSDEREKWRVEGILKHCTLENNILKLCLLYTSDAADE